MSSTVSRTGSHEVSPTTPAENPDLGQSGSISVDDQKVIVVPSDDHLLAGDDESALVDDNNQNELLEDQQQPQRFNAQDLQFQKRSTGWATLWGSLTGIGVTGAGAVAGGVAAAAIAGPITAGAIAGGTIGLGFMGLGAVPGMVIGAAIGGVVGLLGGSLVGNAVSRRKANRYIENFQQRSQANGRTFSQAENRNIHNVGSGEWKELLSIRSRDVDKQETRNDIRDVLIERVATHGLDSAKALKADLLAMNDGDLREALVSADARSAMTELGNKGWLTGDISAGFKKLSPTQERALLRLGPDLNLSGARSRQIKAQVLLAAGRSMTATAATPDYAMHQALQVKQRLIAQHQDGQSVDLPRKIRPSAQQLAQEKPVDHELDEKSFGEDPKEKLTKIYKAGPDELGGDLGKIWEDEKEIPDRTDYPAGVDPSATGQLKSLVPAKIREHRTETIVSDFQKGLKGLKDAEPRDHAPRLAIFKNPAYAFDKASDAYSANRSHRGKDKNLVNAAIHDQRKTALMALGLASAIDPDDGQRSFVPAAGLEDYDIARFQQLALTSTAIKDRSGRFARGRPLKGDEKDHLKQQLHDAKVWVDQRLAQNLRVSVYRQSFMRDFRILSKSGNLKQLQAIDPKLKAIESEIEEIQTEFQLAGGVFDVPQRFADVAKGSSAEHRFKPERESEQTAYREQRLRRMTGIVQSENHKMANLKYGSLEDKAARVNSLRAQKNQLMTEQDKFQKAFDREAEPMVGRYGDPPFNFDASLKHWRPGSTPTDFPAMQNNTIDTLKFVRKQLLPDLEKKLDLLPTED